MSESWLTRNVRPIVCLALCGTAVVGSFLPSAEVSERLWDVLQLTLATYVAGRTIEKVSREGGLPWSRPHRGRDES